MYKPHFLLFFLLTSILSFSQVGINTTSPDPSSVLDVSSSNKGILFPRVSLLSTSDNNTVSKPAVSLVVYNTSFNRDLVPGFYYWNGTNWNPFTSDSGSGSSGDDWSLSGNKISGDEFLGTTNYTALKLKVNNSQLALFDPHGGFAIGYGAIANNENSIAIGRNANAAVSNQATAIGPTAIASGFQSAAFGYNAQAITRNSTLAIGNSSIASSYQATAIGVNAKASQNNNALAIGTASEATGENSTAIGEGAIASQNNAVVIGNIKKANVGIGTSTPNTNAKLDVNGQFKLGEKGNLQKGISSFKINGLYVDALPANKNVVKTVDIPSDARPSSTNATVFVTASNDFNDDVIIAFARLISTSKVRISFLNTGSKFEGDSSSFYVSIIEF